MPEDEKFLSRWSRLKHEAAATAPAATAGVPAPAELPPIDSLGFDSDFSGFLRAKVDEKLKQAALKKLFQSPHFNQMDGLDVYIDDYNTFEPIPESMLRELNHAQDLLFAKPADGEAEDPVVEAKKADGEEEGAMTSIEPAAAGTGVRAEVGTTVPLPEAPVVPAESDNHS
jgi:hypothetical protein